MEAVAEFYENSAAFENEGIVWSLLPVCFQCFRSTLNQMKYDSNLEQSEPGSSNKR